MRPRFTGCSGTARSAGANLPSPCPDTRSRRQQAVEVYQCDGIARTAPARRRVSRHQADDRAGLNLPKDRRKNPEKSQDSLLRGGDPGASAVPRCQKDWARCQRNKNRAAAYGIKRKNRAAGRHRALLRKSALVPAYVPAYVHGYLDRPGPLRQRSQRLPTISARRSPAFSR